MNKKIISFIVCLVAYMGSFFSVQAQQALPTSGGYYLIKSQQSPTLYMGGNGTGNNAIKYELAATNTAYHIFLLEGDNTAGWTFKQYASGLFVTHNNSYVGSYAAAVGTNRQLFRFDNTANTAYLVIKRKFDDGTWADGIGADNNTVGSSLYMDKGANNNFNRWLLEEQTEQDVVNILSSSLLTAIVTTAQNALDATDNPGYINTAELQAAIAAAQGSLSTLVALNAAIADLNTAIANYNAIIAVYAPLKVAIAAANTLADATDYPGAAAFDIAIAAAQTVFDNTADQSADIAAAVTALNAAKKAYVLTQTASEDAPADFTGLLLNPDFETAPIAFTATNQTVANYTEFATDLFIPTGWTSLGTIITGNPRYATVNYGITFTSTPAALNGITPPATDKNGATGAGLTLSAAWAGTATVSQSVALPAGIYKLLYDVVDLNNGKTIATNYFGFVPEEGTAIYSTKTVYATTWATDTVSFSLNAPSEGNIRLGLQGVAGKGSADQAKLFIDNVRILYYGVDLEAMRAALLAQAELAEETYTDIDMQATVATALAEAIEEAVEVANNEAATQEEIEAAVVQLTTAANAAAASVAKYAELAAAIAAADVSLENNLTLPGYEVFEALIETISADYEAAIYDADAVDAAIAELATATLVFLFTAEIPLDATSFVISNPSFEGGSTKIASGSGGGEVYQPEGWTLEHNLAGWNDVNVSSSAADHPTDGVKFFNAWAGTVNLLELYQDITLPVAGTYTLSAAMRVEHATEVLDQHIYAIVGEDAAENSSILTFKAAELEDWKDIAAWDTVSVEFVVPTGGATVRIGAKSTGGASSVGWFQADDFRLLCTAVETPEPPEPPEPPVSVNDVVANDNLIISNVNNGVNIQAKTAAHVQIFSVVGQLLGTRNLAAGESTVVALPQGLYIVNGQKIIVK